MANQKEVGNGKGGYNVLSEDDDMKDRAGARTNHS